MKIRNTFIIFLVSGFWHGANWTFLVWGFLNAVYFLPLLLLGKNRSHMEIVASNRFLPSFRDFIKIIITFSLTIIAWVFFRAENITHALSYLFGMFSDSLFTVPEILPRMVLLLILFFIFIEWLGRRNEYAIEKLTLKAPRVYRWSFYFIIAMLIFLFDGKEQAFIYFQF